MLTNDDDPEAESVADITSAESDNTADYAYAESADSQALEDLEAPRAYSMPTDEKPGGI